MNRTVENYDYLFRVILVGDSGVGKSNLLLRYTKNDFDASSHSTIGVDFSTKTVKIDTKVIKAQIWDTAGQDRFKSISTAFYRGSAAALLVYDISNYATFNNLGKWLEDIKKYADTNVVLMLVGNKSDLDHSRAVSVRDATAFAEKHRMSYIETSALNSTNVEKAFVNIIREVYLLYSSFKKESATEESTQDLRSELNTIKLNEDKPVKDEKCCSYF